MGVLGNCHSASGVSTDWLRIDLTSRILAAIIRSLVGIHLLYFLEGLCIPYNHCRQIFDIYSGQLNTVLRMPALHFNHEHYHMLYFMTEYNMSFIEKNAPKNI